MSRRQAPDWSVVVPFLLVTLIWSSTWLVIKDQLGADLGAQPGAVPPPWSVTYRFTLAATAMFVVTAVQGTSLRVGGAGHLLAAIVGVPQFVLNFNFVYAAEQFVTSGIVAVVFALLVVPNALLSRIAFGHPMGHRFLAGSGIAIIGIVLLFVAEVRAADIGDTGNVVLGIGFTLLAVLSASIANVLQATKRAAALPVTALLAWSMFYGALFNALIASAMAGPPVADPRISYWLGVAYLGLVGSAFAFILYFRMMRVIGPGKAAYTSVMVPIVAMGLSTVFEAYHWTGMASLGGVVTMAGLMVALSGRRNPASD